MLKYKLLKDISQTKKVEKVWYNWSKIMKVLTKGWESLQKNLQKIWENNPN